MLIKIPFGKSALCEEIDDRSVVLETTQFSRTTDTDERQIVREAMQHPFGGKTLETMANGKRTATIIISDHTRPVPSKVILPFMLEELRKASPSIKITLLVATGCHRETTAAELKEKLGDQIYENEQILVHDCDDSSQMIPIGELPSGALMKINRLALETDLLISEGFIEPHFFAGFSGGRKSVLPGVVDRITVLGNHCSKFIASPYAKTGILQQNPIHRDMVEAARMARLAYIVNVVLDHDKKVVAAFAGDPELAHAQGCAFVNRYFSVPAVKGDIVITSNGGYPLDQNVYQTVKGMTAAEQCLDTGGVIIMAAACNDGTGGDAFYRAMKECSSPEDLLSRIEAVEQCDTTPDQWQYQIFARILAKNTVIFVSEITDHTLIENMKMIPARNLKEALEKAYSMKGRDAKIVVIPDGVSIIIKEESCVESSGTETLSDR